MRNPFHAVRQAVHGKTVTYAIYCNNEPFLEPAQGQSLRKWEADRIAGMLNYVPKCRTGAKTRQQLDRAPLAA